MRPSAPGRPRERGAAFGRMLALALGLSLSLPARAQPSDPEPGEAEPGEAEPGEAEPGEGAPSEPNAGAPEPGAPQPTEPRPDWGVASGLDTVSPWEPKSDDWGDARETVSPWPVGAKPPEPAPEGPEVTRDVDARIDLRFGERQRRRVLDPLVRGGIYDRPYLLRVGTDATAVAIGGYFDFLGAYERVEGVSDGFSFEARRFNLFLTSRIADRLRLTSELEFEHGTERISLETALCDVLLHHTFNLRAGILLSPIGRFNITHDAPLYDVVDRPLVSTRIIPATLSEPGAGFFGAFYPGAGHRLTYEVYVTSGLGVGVIAAEGTRLSEGRSPEVFAADNNGSPAVVGRLSFQSRTDGFVQGEVAASGYAGVYNTFAIEDQRVDDPRWLRVLALDASTSAGPVALRGELAVAGVDVPDGLTSLHARRQYGAYLDTTVTFFQRPLWLFELASLAAVARVDYVDLNLDDREGTGEPMGEEHTRLSVGISFRPAPGTALRLVYHHDWLTDELGNPTRAAGVQLGLATYF